MLLVLSNLQDFVWSQIIGSKLTITFKLKSNKPFLNLLLLYPLIY